MMSEKTHNVIEASQLGFAPGRWPVSFMYSGRKYVARFGLNNAIKRDAEGGIESVTYDSDDDVLEVLND